MTAPECVTDHTFLGDNKRRCAHWHCDKSIGHHLHNQADDAADPDVVYVLIMDWNNSQSYSEGDEITVHRSRAEAVTEILATVHGLGLDDGLADDPDGNDPASSDQGDYMVDYRGRLSFRIQRCELPPSSSPYNDDIAEPHNPDCPRNTDEQEM